MIPWIIKSNFFCLSYDYISTLRISLVEHFKRTLEINIHRQDPVEVHLSQINIYWSEIFVKKMTKSSFSMKCSISINVVLFPYRKKALYHITSYSKYHNFYPKKRRIVYRDDISYYRILGWFFDCILKYWCLQQSCSPSRGDYKYEEI